MTRADDRIQELTVALTVIRDRAHNELANPQGNTACLMAIETVAARVLGERDVSIQRETD